MPCLVRQLSVSLRGLVIEYRRVRLQGTKPESLKLVPQPEVREFIELCITRNPGLRPASRELLKHSFFDDVRMERELERQAEHAKYLADYANHGPNGRGHSDMFSNESQSTGSGFGHPDYGHHDHHYDVSSQ